ncbi:MAG TPA: UbiA family prenyltransferase [Nitrososphaerales archaeon]|nr:UbiA family prenyltransferase [Nitrososphaerales archaeon]
MPRLRIPESTRRKVSALVVNIGSEFIYGGHLLALGTSSIAAFCAMLLGRIPSIQLLAMAYLFSYGAYSMNRALELDQDALSNPQRTRYLSRRKRYIPAITASCFGLGYILAFLSNVPFFLALLIPLVLSVAYSVGSKKLLLPLLGAKRLKEKLLVKNITISLGWSLIPVLVGLYYQQVGIILFALGVFVFLRLFVNTVFFDERDVKGDIASGVRTMPIALGIRKTNFVLNLVDFSSAAYGVFLITIDLLPIYSIVILALPAYSMAYRWLSTRKQGSMNLLCDIVGDGEYLLWGVLLLLGRVII